MCLALCFPERQWNMWIPGYGSDEIRPFKKACTTEAHKQVSKSCITILSCRNIIIILYLGQNHIVNGTVGTYHPCWFFFFNKWVSILLKCVSDFENYCFHREWHWSARQLKSSKAAGFKMLQPLFVWVSNWVSEWMYVGVLMNMLKHRLGTLLRVCFFFLIRVGYIDNWD